MKTKIQISLLLIVICLNSCKRTNCHNRIKDGDETGIDCGGPCFECPPSVTTLLPNQIGINSAWVSMQYYSNPSTSINSIGICYNTSPNPAFSKALISNNVNFNSTGIFQGMITGLLSGTTYYVRGYLRDNNGIAYGNEVSFTTASIVPILPTIVTTTVTAITPTTAVSGGDITNDGGAPVTTRGICFSTATNPTTANSVIAGGSGIGSFSSSLTGLSATTTYYIRAFAINSVGTAYGSQVSFTTTGYVIPTLTTTVASSITKTTAISGGNISSDGGAAVTSRGICYNKTGSPTTASSLVSGGIGIGSFISNLTGLSAATTYYVRAYAINSIGIAYGNQISFSTSAPFTIGQSYGGGLIAYLDGTGEHGFIVSSSNIGGGTPWWNGSNIKTGATGIAIGTGKANTDTIIVSQGNTGSYAAKNCRDYTSGGYSDWYLPSKDELYQLFINRVALGLTNPTYLFWSSSELSTDMAFEIIISSGSGTFYGQFKNSTYSVRAVRSF